MARIRHPTLTTLPRFDSSKEKGTARHWNWNKKCENYSMYRWLLSQKWNAEYNTLSEVIMIMPCVQLGLLTHDIIHLSTGLNWSSIATSYVISCIDWNCNIPDQGAIYNIWHWNPKKPLSRIIKPICLSQL